MEQKRTWRPKDWEKLTRKEVNQFESLTGECSHIPRDIFETGADAILDALIKKTGRFTLNHETTYVSKDGGFSGVILETGWEVFILNDEAKE